MPLYEYECDACGQRFEVIRKFSDPPLETCARCGKSPIRRLQSSPAFQFKGTGWYVTDYAGKSSGEKGGEKGGEKQGGKTADPKSAEGKSGGESTADTTAKPNTDGTPSAKSDSATKPAAGSSTPGESKSKS